MNWECRCIRCRSFLQEAKLSPCAVENFNNDILVSKKLLTAKEGAICVLILESTGEVLEDCKSELELCKLLFFSN